MMSTEQKPHSSNIIIVVDFVTFTEMWFFFVLFFYSHVNKFSNLPIRADAFILREHSGHTLALNMPNSALAGALPCFQV